jgi:hypothetical protein
VSSQLHLRTWRQQRQQQLHTSQALAFVLLLLNRRCYLGLIQSAVCLCVMITMSCPCQQ